MGTLRVTVSAVILAGAALWALESLGASAPESTRDRDGSHAQRCPDGARALFDGATLTGWGGARDGYRAEAGVLHSLPDCSGDLVTREQFSDFRLDFEFRLQPGSNSGIGIRAPFQANAAYDGMEIQILDDTLAIPRLKPHQRHGSIYGVVPAPPRILAPPGIWNRETIIADGSHVVVMLNGRIVVDADLQSATERGTIDRRSHPGLFRPSGHIHLCSHGDPVEFRSICITELRR